MTKENIKIEIRPIPGRNGIKEFSENLEFFSQAHIIAPFVNPVTRKYDTGLSKEDIEYLQKDNFPYDITDTYLRGVAHEFWESEIVKMELTTSPMFLFPYRSHIDFIKWKYLLVNSYIYKSEKEMKMGTKPEATHFIYNVDEETKIRATGLEQRNKLIQKVSDLTLQRKRDLILILLNESTDNKKDEYLTVRFEDILNDKEMSSKLKELLEKRDEDVTLSAEIKTAIQSNVLTRTKQGIFFFESNLGFSEEDVHKFLVNPENQEILLTIKSKIQ